MFGAKSLITVLETIHKDFYVMTQHPFKSQQHMPKKERIAQVLKLYIYPNVKTKLETKKKFD